MLGAIIQERSVKSSRSPYLWGAGLLIGTGLLIAGGFYVYRNLSPFWFYVALFGVQVFSGLWSMASLFKHHRTLGLGFHQNVYAEFPPYTGRRKERPGNLRVKEKFSRFLASKGMILDVRLWKMAKRTRVIVVFLVVATILHFSKVTFKAFHPIEYAAVLFFVTFIGLVVFTTSLAVVS